MTAIASNIVFDDIFTINAIDKEGKKFDRGSLISLLRIAFTDIRLSQSHGYMPILKTTTWTSR